jgi:hypothetical protein
MVDPYVVVFVTQVGRQKYLPGDNGPPEEKGAEQHEKGRGAKQF